VLLPFYVLLMKLQQIDKTSQLSFDRRTKMTTMVQIGRYICMFRKFRETH